MSETSPYAYEKQFDDLPRPVTMVRTPEGRDLAMQRTVHHLTKSSPVFLLHGSPGCRLGPMPQQLNLYMLGVNLITYDRPGYGRSDRHEGRTVADVASEVAAIADALNIERFGVVGRSGGVAGALGCAALLGDRVTSVTGLVGVAPPSETFDRYKGMVAGNVDLHQKALQDPEALQAQYAELSKEVERNPGWFIDSFLWDQMPAVDQGVLSDPRVRSLQLAAYYEALVPQQGVGWVDDTVAANHDWGYDLSAVQQPTLLWHGEYDQFSPYANSDHMAEQIRAGGNENVMNMVWASRGHFGAFEVLEKALAWQRDQYLDSGPQ